MKSPGEKVIYQLRSGALLNPPNHKKPNFRTTIPMK